MTQLALGYPEVGFTLTSGGRTAARSARPSRRSRDGCIQLYGERRDLIEVRKEAGGLQFTATSRRSPSRGRRAAPQNVFVNRRIVKDRTIAHAIIDAYSVASIKERSPEVHLFIEMPPDRVDVNVHPTKAEVRFREQSLVHEVVRRALGDALGQGRAPELQLHADSRRGRRSRPRWRIPGVLAGGVVSEPVGSRARRRGAPMARRRRRDRTRALDAAVERRRCRSASRHRHPPDDPARPVPRHVHHRGRRRGHRDHRSARGARARAVRAGDGAADQRAAREPAAAGADARSSCRRRSGRRWLSTRRRSSASGSRSRSSAATACSVTAVPALLDADGVRTALRALAEDSRGSTRARASRTR